MFIYIPQFHHAVATVGSLSNEMPENLEEWPKDGVTHGGSPPLVALHLKLD